MVIAAAGSDRVFFKNPVVWRGLAGIQQADPGAFQLAHIAGREVGDARKVGDEIEDDPLGLEQDDGRALHADDLGHGRDGGGLLHQHLHVRVGAHDLEDLVDDGQAHHVGVFLGADDGMHGRVSGKKALGGQVGAVLIQGQFYGTTQIASAFVGKKRAPGCEHSSCPVYGVHGKPCA